jgi:hypothetical protein
MASGAMVMNTLGEKLFACAGIAQNMNGKFVAGAQFSFFMTSRIAGDWPIMSSKDQVVEKPRSLLFC